MRFAIQLIMFFVTFAVGGILEINLLYHWSNKLTEKMGKRKAYYLSYVIMYIGFVPFFIMNFIVVREWLGMYLEIPVWTEIIAIGLILFGLGLNYYGIKSLKLYRWNSRPKFGLEDENGVIKEGIFSKLRHPTYLGQIIIFYGAALYYPSFYTLMIALVYNVYMGFIHAKLEERELIRIYGKAYSEYMTEVNGFIPKLLK